MSIQNPLFVNVIVYYIALAEFYPVIFYYSGGNNKSEGDNGYLGQTDWSAVA